MFRLNSFVKSMKNSSPYSLNSVLFTGLQADGQSVVFTDGEYINQIAACKDVSLHSHAHTYSH